MRIARVTLNAVVFLAVPLLVLPQGWSIAVDDTTPPTGTIVINGNRSATNTPNVTLGLTWSDGAGTGVSRMRFSNDGSTWSSWETPVASRAYTLPAGPDSHRTVRVQYLDRAGNRSAAYSDYIRLDTTLPTGTILINGGASVTPAFAVTLGLTWSDGAGTGVSRMRFSDNGSTWTPWMPPTATRAHTLPAGPDGHRTVRVQYLDGAGNYSAVYSDYIRLAADTRPVVTDFSINSGAATTTNPVVTLNNSATGSPTQYMASESPTFSGASWAAYGVSPSFTLSGGTGGVKTVYFKVRNAALVESGVVSDTIDLVERTILLPGSVPLELVRIPAGSYQMGAPVTERSRLSSDGPVHPVTIGYDFYMGKYEVTQGQWLAVMESWPGTAPIFGYGLGANYPAYYVSWNDAQAFIAAVNAHITATGQGPATLRLPSEAEWEYACRAGTQTRFYFGDSLGVGDGCEDDGVRSQYMWYCGNNPAYPQPGQGTKPVGGLLPNGFGLYDMSGNVYEWCEDWWHVDYTGAPSDGSAWVVPTDSHRVIRGGGWYRDARQCRSAFREYGFPSRWYDIVGFRLVSVR